MRRANDLRIELDHLRDNLTEALKLGRTGVVLDGLDMYEELVSTFIAKLKLYGSRYDRTRALQELAAFPGDTWSEIQWITDDFRELLDTALATNDSRLAAHILYFPIRLAAVALRERDYYVFHQFGRWTPYYYRSALDLPESDFQSFVIDRSTRHLEELSQYIVLPELRRASSQLEADQIIEFADAIVLIFNQLLKTAYDEHRLNDFKEFAQALRSLFSEPGGESPRYQIEHLRWRLEHDPLNESERQDIQLDLHVQQALARLDRRKDLLFFGLSAWVVHRYDASQRDVTTFEQWWAPIRSAADLADLWLVYLESLDHHVQQDMGWHWWALDEHPNRGRHVAVSIGLDAYLHLAFSITALELLAQLQPQAREQLPLSLSPELMYLAEGDESPLRNTLLRIGQESGKWTPILGDAGMAMIPVLTQMLRSAVSRQKAENAHQLIAAPLWPLKVQDVKEHVLREWHQQAYMRSLVRRFGEYQHTTESAKKNLFGVNTLDLKEIYVEHSRVSSSDWGEEYGRSLARGENEAVLSRLLAAIPSLAKSPVTGTAIVERATQAVTQLQNDGYDPILILLNSWFAPYLFEKSPDFTRQLESDQPKLLGYFLKQPVFSVRSSGKPFLLAVDLRRVGVWRQFTPERVFEEEEYLADGLSFMVKPYDEAAVQELLTKRPELWRGADGQPRPEEEVVSELLQRVHVRIVEQFDFQITDKKAGFKISLAREY